MYECWIFILILLVFHCQFLLVLLYRLHKAGKEMQALLDKAKINGDFDSETYAEKEKRFGTIVFESDMDISCRDAYLTYDSRWELELLFKAYKSNLSMTTTRVQSDFSVFGSEFVNFIATLITRRIINKFISLDLLKNDTYGDLIDDLNEAWRIVTDDQLDPNSTDKNWIHVNVTTMDLMKKLGITN